MSAFMRYAGLAAAAGLIGLAGCGSAAVRSPGGAQSPAPATTAPSATSPAPSTATPKPTAAPTGKPSLQPGSPAQACSPAGTYLTAVTTGEHSGYDRVVFRFSGKPTVLSPYYPELLTVSEAGDFEGVVDAHLKLPRPAH